jgi:hypothetical protein
MAGQRSFEHHRLRQRVHAELKGLSSSDVDMPSFIPDVEGLFGFWCHAEIGPWNEEGSDLFQFCVCSPLWLASQMSDGKSPEPMFGQDLIIMNEYDFGKVFALIDRYLARCTGESWSEIAPKIGRVGSWEFEDYQP